MTQIRSRTDCHWPDADKRRWLDEGRTLDDDFLSPVERARILALPPIEPGDAWRVNWSNGNLAGYAIICPTCRQVHTWTTAQNCTVNVVDGRCEHNRLGTGSCWQWSGSLETGDLTAMPSLHSPPPGCGWHGWLRNGQLVEV